MYTFRKLTLALVTVVIFILLTTAYAHAQTTTQPAPDAQPSSYQLGLSFQVHGQDQQAIAEFSAAIQAQPTIPDLYIARADSEVALQQYTLAISDYTQALALNRNDVAVYAKRSFAFAAQGNWKSAQRDFEHFAQSEFLF